MKSSLCLVLLLLLASCAKPTEQKVSDGIDVAQTFLSDGECDKAQKVLSDLGHQDDAVYLQVLASAYACKANFSTIDFIKDDIPKIKSDSNQDLLKSLSILSLSDEKTVESSDYKNLLKAINVILNEGDKQPSHLQRLKKYGRSKAEDMGMELLLFSMTQLGKFLNFYGNVDEVGKKGAGDDGTNHCFINYTYSNAQAVRAASGGACVSNSDGHPELSIVSPSTTLGQRRRCEGLMLFTNMIDVLENMDFKDFETFDSFEEIADQAGGIVDAAITANPALEKLLRTTSQKNCEELLESTSESNNMELIYALLFEAGLQ